MNSEFERLGAVRGAVVVIVAAMAAVAGLSVSGVTITARDYAAATITPQSPAPTARVAPGRPRGNSAHRDRTAAAIRRRKHCHPVDGIEFSVSAGRHCPRALKRTGRRAQLPAHLRKAVSRQRPRPTIAATTSNRSSTAAGTTVPRATTGKTTEAKPVSSKRQSPAASQSGGVEAPSAPPAAHKK
jgi:hypothetical protein